MKKLSACCIFLSLIISLDLIAQKKGTKKIVNKAAEATEKGADKVKDKTVPTPPPTTHQYNTDAQTIWDIQFHPTLKGLTGEVIMQIPKEVQFNTHMEFYEAGDNKKAVASWFGNNKAKLMPGLYDILIDKKYIIKNVPVEQGKQTRLKMGVLQWGGYGSIVLEDTNHQKFSYGAPFKKVLPVGTYTIVGRKQKPNTFVITDGKLTEF